MCTTSIRASRALCRENRAQSTPRRSRALRYIIPRDALSDTQQSLTAAEGVFHVYPRTHTGHGSRRASTTCVFLSHLRGAANKHHESHARGDVV